MSTPTDPQAAFQQLVLLHQYARIVGYCGVSAFTWFIFDYVMTWSDEVEYVWKKPWGLAKILFLWMRYFGVVLLTINIYVSMTGNHTAKYNIVLSCQGYFYWEGSGGSIMLYTVEIILQLRIFAMYNKKKWLTYFNLVLFVIEIVVMLVVYNIGIHAGITLPTPPGLTGCYGITTSYLFSIWLPGLAFELWLVVLALYKAVDRSRRGIMLDGRKEDLLTLLIRDNVIYFVMIAAGLFANAMMWFVGPDGLAPAAVSLSHASMFISGSRLLLNLRIAYYNNANSNTTVGNTTGGDMTSQWAPAARKLPRKWDVDTTVLLTDTVDYTMTMSRPDGFVLNTVNTKSFGASTDGSRTLA